MGSNNTIALIDHNLYRILKFGFWIVRVNSVELMDSLQKFIVFSKIFLDWRNSWDLFALERCSSKLELPTSNFKFYLEIENHTESTLSEYSFYGQIKTQIQGYPIRIDTRLQSRAWNDCPPLEKGPNVKEIKCNNSTCVMKCMPGFVKVSFFICGANSQEIFTGNVAEFASQSFLRVRIPGVSYYKIISY